MIASYSDVQMLEADSSSKFNVCAQDIEMCVELVALHNGHEVPSGAAGSSDSSSSSCSCSSSSSSSARPHHYCQDYSAADIDACVKIMVDSNGKTGARAASTEYFRAKNIRVPHVTVLHHYEKRNEVSDDVLRGSAYLAPSRRQHFADWILTHSRAHMCLTKQLLNLKVMQLAFVNGKEVSKPPGKHFWRDFFQEVGVFLRERREYVCE
jgi:hypothetical protein